MQKIKIIPTITTTPGSNWREKMSEISKLGIEEAAIFPTCLEKEKRNELYRLIEKSSLKRIPYVHLRNDMGIEELDYFVQNFKTEVFNIHTNREYPFICDYSKYRKMIYIENVFCPLNEKELASFGGVCVDFSHLENDRLFNERKFEQNIKIVEKFKIGCNHISAVKKEFWLDFKNSYEKNKKRYDYHSFKELAEFDYLENYPLKYFSSLVAMELENSIEEQLRAGEYIKKIIENLK